MAVNLGEAAALLREAVTVLDEPYHRENVAAHLLQIADLLEYEQLAHQETRGTVAALKQEYARLVRNAATPSSTHAAPSDVETWRPIDTAHRDGTPILLTDGRLIGVAKLTSNDSGTVCNWGSATEIFWPTHWRPLPKLPVSK